MVRTKKERPWVTGLGARLKTWREEKGWSQADAAKELGTEQRRWGDWELEDSVPDYDIALKLEALSDGRFRMADWALVTRALRTKDESDTDVAAAADKAG